MDMDNRTRMIAESERELLIKIKELSEQLHKAETERGLLIYGLTMMKYDGYMKEKYAGWFAHEAVKAEVSQLLDKI